MGESALTVRVYPEEFREELTVGELVKNAAARDLALEYRVLRYLTETDEMGERMRGFDKEGRDRYRDIRPYLDNIAHGLNGLYVNASFVSSPATPNAYIVSQAPLSKTVSDWLGMLARHDVAYVFCLTVCDSVNKHKPYWPSSDSAGASEQLGDSGMSVSLRTAAETVGGTGLVRRELQVQFPASALQDCTSTSGQFSFQHVHFTQWPDHGVPELATLLPVVAALEEARRLSGPSRPVVVHCSAGVGRAGTLVAIANCLERARLSGKLSVLEEVVRLRMQRPLLVQTTAHPSSSSSSKMGVLEETRDRLSELPFIEEREKSLAKVSKAINRLKRLGQEERVELALEQLNLRLHLDEVLASLAELLTSSLKLKDVDKFVAVVVSLQLSYNKQILAAIEEALVTLLSSAAADAVRKRVALRVLAELTQLFPQDVKKPSAMSEFFATLPMAELATLTTLNSFLTRFSDGASSLGQFALVRATLETRMASDVLATSLVEAWRKAAGEEVKKAEEAASRLRIATGAVDADTETKLKDARALVAKVETQIATLFEFLGRATPQRQHSVPVSDAAAQAIPSVESDTSGVALSVAAGLPTADPLYSVVSVGCATGQTQPKSALAADLKTFMGEFERIRDLASSELFIARRAKEALQCRTTSRWLLTRLWQDAAAETSEPTRQQRQRQGRRSVRPLTVYQVRVVAALAASVREFQSQLAAGAKSAASSCSKAEVVGELTKFQVLPTGQALEMLEETISASQLEVAVTLLQTCGDFLARNPDTQNLVETQVERLWRLKNAKHDLPEHVEAQIDDVYLAMRPGQGRAMPPAGQRRQSTELEQYLEHQLQDRAAMSDHVELAQKIQACHVADERLTRKTLLRLERLPATGLVHLAAALGQFPVGESLVVRLVDELFEAVQRGLDAADPLANAQRFRQGVLVSELFMEQVLDFDCLLDSYLATLLAVRTAGERRGPRAKTLAAIPEAETSVLASATTRQWLEEAAVADWPLRARMVQKTLEICGTCLAKSRFRDVNRLGLLLQGRLLENSEFPNDLRLEILNLLEKLELAVVANTEELEKRLEENENERATTRRSPQKTRPTSRVPIVDPREKQQPMLEEQRELDAQLAALMGGGKTPEPGYVPAYMPDYEGVRMLLRPKRVAPTVPEGVEVLAPKRTR